MKQKVFFAFLVIIGISFSSCEVGRYVPRSINVFGAQTQVVLSQANFRVVRDVELIVDIDNDHIRHSDAEKSAFVELMKKYPLVGSQVYTNVIIEEVRREANTMNGGLTDLKQYISIRATIIEFLKEDGKPVAP